MSYPTRKRKFSQLNNDNTTHYDSHDGNFGTYIGNKRRKLIHQFREDVEIESNIFENHVMWINGHTNPPLSELKELIVANGGIAQTVMTKHTTTIIADNLPITKLKQYRKTNSDIIITTPQWILRSIEAAKLLKPSHFPLSNDVNRRASSSFFKAPSNENALTKAFQTAHFRTDAEKNNSNTKDSTDNGNNAQIETKQDDDIEATNQDNGNNDDDGNEHDRLLKIFGVRSTLTDPNFVENYFKTSRLHFIGSFKQIYEEILPDLQQISPKYDTLQFRQQNRHRKSRYIVHVDMDCYFVSVAIRDKPELKEKPCVVCHSQSSPNSKNNRNSRSHTIPKSQSTSEISSANYAARKFGVRASMYLSSALKLCPNLTVLPYKFSDYVMISKQIYRIFFSYTNLVQYQSIDEAYLQFPGSLSHEEIVSITNSIRQEILAQTKCPSSAGISGNILLARLATRKAKPNGTYFLNATEDELGYQEIMDKMNIDALPGIGWRLTQKFNHDFQIKTVGDLRQHPRFSQLRELQQEFGQKIGLNIYNYLNGIDERELQILKPRKSVGAEIGWGVRFKHVKQLKRFVDDLSMEVSKRMRKIHEGLKGKHITIRVKTKHPEADEEPHKFLGHGWCETVTKSITLNVATNDHRMIAKTSWNILLHQLRIDETIVRAVGIHISKLNYDKIMAQQGFANIAGGSHRSIQSMFAKQQAKKKQSGNVNPVESMDLDDDADDDNENEQSSDEYDDDDDNARNKNRNRNSKHHVQAQNVNFAVLPAFSQIDENVLDSLPREIQLELSKAYKNQLLLNKHNSRMDKVDVIDQLKSKFNSSVIVSGRNKKSTKATKPRNHKRNSKKLTVRKKQRDAKQTKLNLIAKPRAVGNEEVNKRRHTELEEVRCNAEQNKKKEREKDDGALFEEESFEEYREILLRWLNSEKHPNESHQLLLQMYIDDCIEMHRLTNVVLILKYLQRYAVRDGNENWHNVSDKVIKTTQARVAEKYGYKLKIGNAIAFSV